MERGIKFIDAQIILGFLFQKNVTKFRLSPNHESKLRVYFRIEIHFLEEGCFLLISCSLR